MSSINIPIMAGINATLAYAPLTTTSTTTFSSICSSALSLVWGSIELIIAMGAITAFSHLLCFAAALSLPSSTSSQQTTFVDLVDEDSDSASSKEKTCALVLSALLSGLHVVVVFFGLPLFGFGGESFPLKNLYSIAVLAAGTTGAVVGVIVVCLLVPVGKACARVLCRGSGAAQRDVEALRQQEEEQKGFLEKAVFQINVEDVDAEEEE